MTKLKEMVAKSNNQQQLQDRALVYFTIAVYLLTAGTLMEYVNTATLLKIIGFMLTGHAFYFLWKSHTFSKL